MAAIKAFREPQLISDPTDDVANEFNTWNARRTRYALLWAYLENTAYRNLHTWAQRYKTDYGLYKFTRAIYNPAYRLAEFYRTHIWGGRIDYDSDGAVTAKGAIPIETDSADLRKAIGMLFRASNWELQKGLTTLRGAATGDVALQIVDDTVKGRVYLRSRLAAEIRDLELDAWGNVKAYEIVERRADPSAKTVYTPTTATEVVRTVEYAEIATRDGESVVYRTFKDGAPFDWTNNGIEWSVPYGFIPMVVIQHNNVGLPWGWAELFPALSKVREIDDVASKLSDQIRKSVDPAWLGIGMKLPEETKTSKSTTPNDQSAPEKQRQDTPWIYGPAGADAKPLIANVDIAATLSHIKGIADELENEFPELKAEKLRISGAIATGRAMRLAQGVAEDKVRERRPNYDNALVRANQMAVAIGGWRAYRGYEGFDLNSYAAGTLSHSIADRPVFSIDPLDDIEAKQAETNALKSAGFPEEYIWQRAWDMTEQDVAQVQALPSYQAKQEMQRAAMTGLGGN